MKRFVVVALVATLALTGCGQKPAADPKMGSCLTWLAKQEPHDTAKQAVQLCTKMIRANPNAW